MTTAPRQYQVVAAKIRKKLAKEDYAPGDRIPPERQWADLLQVSRSLVREALIMLEIQGLVEIRQGSGIYISEPPYHPLLCNMDDIGPFELLQARQVIESNIAALAALEVNKQDINRMQIALEKEREAMAKGLPDEDHDERFHLLIAEASKNAVLSDTVVNLWKIRRNSSMWQQLHKRIFDNSYRVLWLEDHQFILNMLKKRDPDRARIAMWQHLENVRETLMALSDADDPDFDGYLFRSISAENLKN